MGQNIAVWIKLFNLRPLVTKKKKKDIIINTRERKLQLYVSRGTFPEVLIIDKKERGRVRWTPLTHLKPSLARVRILRSYLFLQVENQRQDFRREVI